MLGEQLKGLFCPKCLSTRLEVDQTLPGLGGIVRRRKCANGHAFVTEERTCDRGIYNLAHRVAREGKPRKPSAPKPPREPTQSEAEAQTYARAKWMGEVQ